MRRAAAALATAAVLTAVCSTAPTPAAGGRVTALVGGRVLTSPQAAVIPDGVVLIEDATITAVGARGVVRVPPGRQNHRLLGRDGNSRLLEQPRPLHGRRLPRSRHRARGVARRRAPLLLRPLGTVVSR